MFSRLKKLMLAPDNTVVLPAPLKAAPQCTISPIEALPAELKAHIISFLQGDQASAIAFKLSSRRLYGAIGTAALAKVEYPTTNARTRYDLWALFERDIPGFVGHSKSVACGTCKLVHPRRCFDGSEAAKPLISPHHHKLNRRCIGSRPLFLCRDLICPQRFVQNAYERFVVSDSTHSTEIISTRLHRCPERCLKMCPESGICAYWTTKFPRQIQTRASSIGVKVVWGISDVYNVSAGKNPQALHDNMMKFLDFPLCAHVKMSDKRISDLIAKDGLIRCCKYCLSSFQLFSDYSPSSTVIRIVVHRNFGNGSIEDPVWMDQVGQHTTSAKTSSVEHQEDGIAQSPNMISMEPSFLRGVIDRNMALSQSKTRLQKGKEKRLARWTLVGPRWTPNRSKTTSILEVL